MMKVVILRGDERHVDAVMRENKIRVGRGLIEFAPADSLLTHEGVTEKDESLKAALADNHDRDTTDTPDTKDVEDTDSKDADTPDTKDEPMSDTKETEESTDTKVRRKSRK